MATIRASLDRQVKKGTVAAKAAEAALARIAAVITLDPMADCDLVKSGIIRQLDAVCKPQAILASSTSSILLTQLAAVSQHPGRVIGMHFFNPVPVMQLVEIISDPQRISAFLSALFYAGQCSVL